MKNLQLFAARVLSSITLGLGALCVILAVGCAEPEAEKGPEDVEKARQDHIKTSQRELGNSSQP